MCIPVYGCLNLIIVHRTRSSSIAKKQSVLSGNAAKTRNASLLSKENASEENENNVSDRSGRNAKDRSARKPRRRRRLVEVVG